ncbi:twin-arginine translocase subunit TatC [Geoalkalibacter halelectricus]|uniref:Sec-independent protein translocase protein TatC n=1 Tax=Geoalkalibacter halelectricus TaxID=2847045 RepID=A0ABY5ZM29_9BACT|nr:twin-arginine translocase subunit TatC [Geoalkalibacter halelectricus]MDO3378458.1 twin-arginine translocase subunit TatC [Geoalkalibacter halelectricus]UWZ80222.1 twin-arginine translocase subunit TatC [Geoalkalibacter halelectricus]
MADKDLTGDEQPFTTHLEELRKRLMISAGAWLVGFLACYGFASKIFDFIAAPVKQALPEGSSLVFITATEPFFTYLKVGAMAGLLLALPVILWQIWGFIAPGLYAHEKRFAVPFVLASFLCFLSGTYFGFFFVFPNVFTFLIKFGTGAGDIDAMLSMGAYLSISIKLLFAFGMVFELPIIMFFLGRMGVVDHHWLKKNRKYALLFAFVLGAMLTPPDLISQTALALPFAILYEVSIWIVRFTGKRRSQEEDESEGEAAAGA